MINHVKFSDWCFHLKFCLCESSRLFRVANSVIFSGDAWNCISQVVQCISVFYYHWKSIIFIYGLLGMINDFSGIYLSAFIDRIRNKNCCVILTAHFEVYLTNRIILQAILSYPPNYAGIPTVSCLHKFGGFHIILMLPIGQKYYIILLAHILWLLMRLCTFSHCSALATCILFWFVIVFYRFRI